MKRFNDARDIFFTRRFGMFIHWGLYAIHGWQEQELWRTKIKRRDYEQLIHQFNPVNFDPEAWVDAALEAGVQYICFTTKHCDGFCMFDTKYTDYNIMNSPYGRDILKELADACHKKGMPLSLYYSLPDWHHPDYPNLDRRHQMFGPRPGEEQNESRYFEYLKNQMVELLTNYGPIYQLFWDANNTGYYDPSINELARQLQPGILINNRGADEGDYQTPERRVPEGKEFKVPTEGNTAFGRESWGYRPDEDYYTDKYLMQSMDKILSMGGNYLINVGPKPDGTLPEENLESLRCIHDWYSRVQEAFVDAVPASYMVRDDRMFMSGDTDLLRDEYWVTRRGNNVYIHLPVDPQSSAIVLPPLDILPRRATLLNDGRELEARVDIVPWHWQEPPYLRIRGLPNKLMSNEVMVVKLEFGDDAAE